MAAAGQGAQMSGAYAGASYRDLGMAGWTPYPGSADADLLPDLETLMSRSRDMGRNNGIAAGAHQTLKDNIVGAQLRLSCNPAWRLLPGWTPDQARQWGNLTEAKFASWAETTACDAAGELNLLGLTLQALAGAMVNGDAIGLPLWLNDPHSSWRTKLLLVESDRLATPPVLTGRDDIRGGIERDYYGKPVAYYIAKRHPGDALAGTWMGTAGLQEWERVPAITEWGRRRVIHLHDKERTGSSRGKPVVSAVMREFHMAGKYAANELEAAVANSLVAAFLESDLGPDSAAALFGEDKQSVRDSWRDSLGDLRVRSMKGAGIIPLPVGAKLSPFTPGRPNAAFEAFMLATLRHIAAGLNMPYELLLKDFSKSNYSSARAALMEAWRYFQGRRRWLMDVWLRPIFDLWLEEAVNAGEIEAPDFYANRYAYTRCRFIFAGRGWIDPVKEAQAAAMRLETGISTLEAECAEQGLDWEEVLEQQSYEQRRRVELGLAGGPAANTIASAAKPEPKRDDDDPEAEELAA